MNGQFCFLFPVRYLKNLMICEKGEPPCYKTSSPFTCPGLSSEIFKLSAVQKKQGSKEQKWLLDGQKNQNLTIPFLALLITCQLSSHQISIISIITHFLGLNFQKERLTAAESVILYPLPCKRQPFQWVLNAIVLLCFSDGFNGFFFLFFLRKYCLLFAERLKHLHNYWFSKTHKNQLKCFPEFEP